MLAIAASGVVAEKTGDARDEYNALSLAVLTILDRWNEHRGTPTRPLPMSSARGNGTLNLLRKLLREHQPVDIYSRLSDRLEQFIAESNPLIPGAADALAAGRLDELGQLVAESQNLAERLLKNQVPETIYLAKSARDYGAVAASSFGAGFGGSVWALVRSAEAEEFLSAWRTAYSELFPKRRKSSTFFLTTGGQPAMDISKLIPASC